VACQVTCTKTFGQKVRPEVYPWLNRAAREVSQVCNRCNEVSRKAGPEVGLPTSVDYPQWL
jgi:hypothetical protein